MLFTVYSSEGDEVLSVKIARRLRVAFQGQSNEKTKLKFGYNLADGK